MLCYLTTKNKICNFFISLLTAGVSIISEQPSYVYICLLGRWHSWTGDANSSLEPDFISRFQEFVDNNCSYLLVLLQQRCVSSIVFPFIYPKVKGFHTEQNEKRGLSKMHEYQHTPQISFLKRHMSIEAQLSPAILCWHVMGYINKLSSQNISTLSTNVILFNKEIQFSTHVISWLKMEKPIYNHPSKLRYQACNNIINGITPYLCFSV